MCIRDRGMDEMLQLARPGNSCEELFDAFNQVLAVEGFRKESRVGYSFGIGYAPDWGEKTLSLRPGDHTVLKEGMCIHMIAGCGDAWAFQTSETVVVTDGQPELLQNTPRKLFVNQAVSQGSESGSSQGAEGNCSKLGTAFLTAAPAVVVDPEGAKSPACRVAVTVCC
eukprot:TRINITY_DN12603_c0_g1_i8.p1 TRINITY_DN12603_c0_g1~~TRINITY_DN12603_c0_g1_i8.p1  ORF type:complete len:168 (-),score=37.49 TRINITY_DN12603_c0_g1_i8:317-820(-)